jgi:hypothetical protein
MMEALKSAAGPDPEEERRRREQAQLEAVRADLERLASGPCTDRKECLAWGEEAIGRLAELVRLTGGDWSASHKGLPKLVLAAPNHAMELRADSETMAFLETNRSSFVTPLATGPVMTAAAALAMLQKLAEWGRRPQDGSPGNSGGVEGTNAGQTAPKPVDCERQGEGTGESGTQSPAGVGQDKVADTEGCIWAPDGDVYLVAGFGERGHLSKLKGLAMIEKLVQSPGQPVPMALLAGCAGEQLNKDKRTKQPTMDMQALQEAYNRSVVLRTELQQAESEGRTLEADEHRTELEGLQRVFQSALGIRGKVRDLNDLANTLRPTIHAALGRVYKAMREANPPMPKLTGHLEAAIGSEVAAFAYRSGLPSYPSWKTSADQK